MYIYQYVYVVTNHAVTIPKYIYIYLRPSRTANHLQDLRLGVLLEHACCVVHGGLDHHQMGRQIHLRV